MEFAQRHILHALHPAIMRLDSLSSLNGSAIEALGQAMTRPHRFSPRGELISEGRAVGGPWLILDGWTARVRQLPDGRRQLVSFGLAGDILGYCQFDGALASTSVVALSPVEVCPLPDPAEIPSLSRIYAISRALDEAYLIAQVTRIGRLNAYERTIDLLLEFHERLQIAGLSANGRFRIPLTQESMSDALGLTPVHLNRTLQQLRRAGELKWTGRKVILSDPDALALSVGHIRPQVLREQG